MELLTTMALLCGAAFAAGVLNAVAGGGSFLTFPALVFAGLPPIVANATSALALSPGYLGSALGFRPELRALPRQRLRRELLICAVGGVLGALLLLVTPARVFSGIVPWLLLFATLLFAVGPALARRVLNAAGTPLGPPRWQAPALLLVAIYGGYFSGGLGILLMALYTVGGESRLNTVNALKNLNSLVLSWLAVGAFVLAGVIAWKEGLIMMLAATGGGFCGARWSRQLNPRRLRVGVVLIGLSMSALFFLRP
ncbi:sulfite exporter TauE/SafE family protein [Hydrogenophaga sp.]|uniref:sulfite exporter TauE/SafE family protein n=1 Tax=Hydrogenophaga sp. TaxID=1904254 RepID=UPI0025C52556|nr:sulfite exporter TauE/SafE family protein [Hydrogenophaga sp.]